MGVYQSNLASAAASEINNISFSSITQQVTQNRINCAATNTANLIFGGNACGTAGFTSNVPININQTATASCPLQSTAVQQTTTNIANQLSNSLQQLASQQNSAVQQWLALAVSVQQSGYTSTGEILNAITQSLQTTSNNTCSAQLVANNTLSTVVCGTFNAGSINVNQDATALGVASCVNKMLSDVISSNTALNSLFQKTDQLASAQQQGVGSLFGGLSSILYVVIAIIVLLIVGAIVYFIIRSRGQSKKT